MRRYYYGRFKFEGTPLIVTLINKKVISYPNIHERINDRAWTQVLYPWLKQQFYKPSYFQLTNKQ